MNTDNNNISLGDIIDNDEKFLLNHLEGKDLGYITSLKNLLAVTYQDLVERKDGVVKKCTEFMKAGDDESAEGCKILVSNLYTKMQSVEDKYNLLAEHIKKVQIMLVEVEN